MYEEEIRQLWPGWEVNGEIGEGTYGEVYRVSYTDEVRTTNSVIKIIPFPRTEVEMDSIRQRFGSDDAVRVYFKHAIDVYKSKMRMLDPFRLNPAFVRVDEYKIKERTDVPGWFLAIRMAPATSLTDYLKKNTLDEKKLIQLGIDICKAIEILDSCGIVHGNIKPENIFVSAEGRFMLGDNVINQMIEPVKVSLSKKKIAGFLAPEEYKNESYDTTADLYGLGMVLYRSLNRGKLPFQSLDTETLSFAQKREAMNRRFNGEELPAPVDASEEFGHIIRKACQYEAGKRYQTASEMREKLEALQEGKYRMLNDPIGLGSTNVHETVMGGEEAANENAKKAMEQVTPSKEVIETPAPKKKAKIQKDTVSLAIFIIGLIILLLGLGLVLYANQYVKNQTNDNKEMTTEAEVTTTEEVVASEASSTEAVSEEKNVVNTEDTRETYIITTTAKEIKLTELTVSYPYGSLAKKYQDYFMFGTAASENDLVKDERASLIVEEFNSITAENIMKPDAMLDTHQNKAKPNLYNTEPVLNFDRADYYLAFAQANGMKVRWHTLVWHSQTPEWFFHEDYDESKPYVSREVMLARMESYIRQVFEHCNTYYPGVVYACDVANEVFEDGSGSMRKSSNWYKVIGEDYIEYAFRYARQYASEDICLCLNDFNEYIPSKRDGIYELAKKLRDQGNLDGIGLQSHLDVGYPKANEYKAMIEKFGSLGVELQVTELDITTKGADGQSFMAQQSAYEDIFNVLVEADRNNTANITSVTVWGLTDDASWRKEQYPLLFNENLQPKMAFNTIMSIPGKYE